MAGRNRAGRRAAPRRGAGALLTAAAAGGVLALSGVLVTGAGAAPAPAAVEAPAPVAPMPESAPAPAATAVPEQAPTSAPAAPEPVADPRAEAFLEALRAEDIPTSDTGEYEVQVAAAVCKELASGADEEELAYRIPPVLPTVTPEMAATLIDVAQEEYC